MDKYCEELIDVLSNVKITTLQEEENILKADRLVDEFTKVKMRKGKVFFIGNGGSAAIAMHMTADFMKNGGWV